MARFGTEHVDGALSAYGRWMVVDEGETADDVVGNLIGVLTSMCARRYGRRGALNRALRAVTATKQPASVEAVR